MIFTLLLAALAHNQWSRVSYFGGWTAAGVVGTHDNSGNDMEYDCSNGNDDDKNYCRTIAAAGAFTLIFGLVGILTASALLVLVVMSLLGQGALAQFNQFVPMLSNVQWICMQAMIMIWGTCDCGLGLSARGHGQAPVQPRSASHCPVLTDCTPDPVCVVD